MSENQQSYYDQIPDGLPKTHHTLVTRLARFLFRAFGWKFAGEIPDLKKAVVTIAPHTSNIDFLILVLAKLSLDLKASYIMKKEAFFWPFKNLFIRIGGIPIDRSQPSRIVSQVTKQIRNHDRIWLVITPEGTRKKVQKYKSGFVRMAHAAKVPIIVVGFDYPNKTIHFAGSRQPTGDHEADTLELQNFYRNTFVGKHPKNQ